MVDQVKIYKLLIQKFKEEPELEMYDGDYNDKSYNFQYGKITYWSFFNHVFNTSYYKNVLK